MGYKISTTTLLWSYYHLFYIFFKNNLFNNNGNKHACNCFSVIKYTRPFSPAQLFCHYCPPISYHSTCNQDSYCISLSIVVVAVSIAIFLTALVITYHLVIRLSSWAGPFSPHSIVSECCDYSVLFLLNPTYELFCAYLYPSYLVHSTDVFIFYFIF